MIVAALFDLSFIISAADHLAFNVEEKLLKNPLYHKLLK
jgi:hypothetical protein